MTRIYKQYKNRIAILSIIVLLSWMGLGYQLFNIQIRDGKEYQIRGNQQGISREILPALRGNIFDINGVPLTRNITRYTIAADQTQIKNKQKLSDLLSKITGKTTRNYINKLNEKGNFVYLERNLPKKMAEPIIEKNIPGVIIQRFARRSYPLKNVGGQLIGFINVDGVGLSGIEQLFNKNLTGTNGWIEKQRTGLGEISVKNNFPKINPIDGANVELTINIEYQSVLQDEIEKQLIKTNAISATGVIINPQSGAILAMASVPDFNPNNPNKSAIENQKIRAVTDQFEPGSTFKFVVATAAIDKNLVAISDEFNCENGSFQYKNIAISDHKPYGVLTFGEIVEHSSNIGIIKIASQIGENKLFKFIQKYGFGQPTNIGITGESSGTFRNLRNWSKISLAEIAMGHEIGVTALQLAIAYAAVANNGILLKPFIIKNIFNTKGDAIFVGKPKAIRKVADQKVMRQLSQLLVNVVDSGTGVAANINGWQVAGKTGTAQKFIDGAYSHSKYVSNFVGYLPANNPQLLCVIVIDEPKKGYHWGGTGAAPVFKKVMERIINLDDSIKPPQQIIDETESFDPILVENNKTNVNNIFNEQPVLLSSKAIEPKPMTKLTAKPISKSTNKTESNGATTVPNVIGMSLKKAIMTLQQSGLESKFVGSGTVVRQSPEAGTKFTNRMICSIELK